METADLIGLAVPATYFIFLAVEKLRPARTFPARKGWQWIGVGFLLLIGAAGATIPLLIPEEWLAAHRWMDGTALDEVVDALTTEHQAALLASQEG